MAVQTPAAEVVVAEEKSVVTETPAAAVVAKEESKVSIPEVAKKAAAPEDDYAAESDSFKEETNVANDLVDPEKKALNELKQLVLAALANNEFNPPPPPPAPAAETAPPGKEKVEPAKQSVTAPAKSDSAQPLAMQPVAPVNEEPLPPPSATATEEKATAKATADDGAKTVEAIAETVVPADTEDTPPTSAAEEPPAPVFIWGVPLLADDRTDAVLLKFLRARDFKVEAAFTMLKNTVIWRKQFGIDDLVGCEELSLPELEKAIFMHGTDREGHPVCYNVYGEFQDKDLYEKAFGDEEKRQRFLKWRIRYLEKGIMELLDFGPDGVSSMVQVTDMRNSPRQGKHRQVAGQALALLQDNYPEFIAKKVFINVSWWSLDYYKMKISNFFTQRTKSKFVFAGPSKSAETLFKYIAPEQVPVAFGGLSKENDPDFTIADAATLLTIKPSSKESIEIPVCEGSEVVWEVRVLGWEVSYGAEFVPSAEDSYTVIVQKNRKAAAAHEPIMKGSYKIGEAGKVFLNIDNPTTKKKKVLYRYKEAKSSAKSW